MVPWLHGHLEGLLYPRISFDLNYDSDIIVHYHSLTTAKGPCPCHKYGSYVSYDMLSIYNMLRYMPLIMFYAMLSYVNIVIQCVIKHVTLLKLYIRPLRKFVFLVS
jgi:hypothetical protein